MKTITLDKVNENVNEVMLGDISTNETLEYSLEFPNTFDYKPYRIASYKTTCGCVHNVRSDMEWKSSKQFYDSTLEEYKDLYTFVIGFSLTKKREGTWVTDLILNLISEESSKLITFRLFYNTTKNA